MPFDTSGDRSRSALPGGNGRAGARVLTLQPAGESAPYPQHPHDPQAAQQQQQQQAPWTQAVALPQAWQQQAPQQGQMQSSQMHQNQMHQNQMQHGQVQQDQMQQNRQQPDHQQGAASSGTGMPPQLERALDDQQWKLEWEGFSESVVDAIESLQYRLQQVEQKLAQQQQMQGQSQSGQGGGQSSQQPQPQQQPKQQNQQQPKQQNQQNQNQQQNPQQKQQSPDQRQQKQQQQQQGGQPQQQQQQEQPSRTGGVPGSQQQSQPGLGGPVGRLRSMLNKSRNNGGDAQGQGQPDHGHLDQGGTGGPQPALYVLWDSGGISGPYAQLQEAQNALNAGEHQAAGGGLRSPNAIQSAPGAGRVVGNGADSAQS